jgi:bacillithiol biosynthesis cysteine-adding enzyme BshC
VVPDKLGYSRLYLDFLAGKAPAVDFFTPDSIDTVAGKLDGVTYDRDRMVTILRRQNEQFGVSEATLERIELLDDPRTVCLFTGQQAGLFGGPLLTLVKALGVLKAARLYSERLDRPVLPIFWIAGDDHDFEEAGHTYLLDRNGAATRLAYEHTAGLAPAVADVKLDSPEELGRLLSELHETLGETDFTADLYQSIEQAYPPDSTLVSAFGRMMASFTRDLGLILFNPADAEVKQVATPFFSAVVEKQDELHAVLADTSQRLKDSGYHVQVEKNPEAVGLFHHQPERVPIMCRDRSFAAGERTWTKAELLAEIESHPERFSPDALTRPVMQSFMFPVISQKCGPSELAYMAQLVPLFDLFERPVPVHAARPTLTVIEKRIGRPMQQMKIGFEDMLGDVEQVVNRVAGETFPVDLQRGMTDLRRKFAHQFDEFADQALGFEPGQKRNADQIKGKIDFLLNGFENKLFAAHKKKSQQQRDRIYRIAAALYPRHGLQERSINICSFIARYGSEVVRKIFDRMDCEETSHQLISLWEPED